MALADTANLIVTLSLKGDFARDMGKASRSLDAFTKGEGRAFKAGAQIGTGIRNAGKIAAVGIGILTSQVALGLDSLIKLEKATAQTEAVIKSTGGAAGITAAQVAKLSEKYESMNAIVGDEFIQAGQNMLLTFTNIKGKAFEPALEAVLNMNTAMGKGPEGLTSTAIQVGKALNDPTSGITALRKAGVTFTEAQVKKIKSLQKEGKLYEAQKIVLAELDKEFGESFLGQGGTTAAKVAKFTDSVDDLQRALATAVLPAVSNVADALSEFLSDDSVIKGAEDLGREIGKLFSKENIGQGIDALRSVFNTAREVAPIVAAAAKTMGGFISAAVSAFKSLPPEIQSLAVAGFAVNKLTGGLVTNIGGGLISAILGQLKSAVVTVHGGVVTVSGPVSGVPGAAAPGAAGGGGKLGTLLAIPIAGAIVAAAVPIGEAFSEALPAGLKGFDGKGMSESQTRISNALALLAKNSTTPKPADREHEGSGVRRDAAKEAIDKTTTAVETMRGNIGDSLGNLRTEVIGAGVTAKNSIMETNATVASGTMIQAALLGSQIATTLTSAYGTQGAVRSVAPPIVSAIRSIPRPVTYVNVNVTATHVTKSTTTQNRYGPGGGSGSQNSRPGDSGV